MTTEGPHGPGAPGPEGRPASEEELQAALEDQMRRLTVPDVIVQTVVTLINLGARRLGLTESTAAGEEAGDERDLEQARMAIEGARALLPLMPGESSQIREALSQLQMAYARQAQGGTGAPAATTQQPGTGPPSEPEPAGPSGSPASDEAERARARAKIWTPGRD